MRNPVSLILYPVYNFFYNHEGHEVNEELNCSQ